MNRIATAVLAVATLAAVAPAAAQSGDRRDARLACREWTARELRVPIDRVEIKGQPTPYANDPSTFRFVWRTSTGAEGVCRVRDGVIRNWEIAFEAPNRPAPVRVCRERVGKVFRVDRDDVDAERTRRDGGTVVVDWRIRGVAGECRVNTQSGKAVLVIP